VMFMEQIQFWKIFNKSNYHRKRNPDETLSFVTLAAWSFIRRIIRMEFAPARPSTLVMYRSCHLAARGC